VQGVRERDVWREAGPARRLRQQAEGQRDGQSGEGDSEAHGQGEPAHAGAAGGRDQAEGEPEHD
jgi:hypothetical protein